MTTFLPAKFSNSSRWIHPVGWAAWWNSSSSCCPNRSNPLLSTSCCRSSRQQQLGLSMAIWAVMLLQMLLNIKVVEMLSSYPVWTYTDTLCFKYSCYTAERPFVLPFSCLFPRIYEHMPHFAFKSWLFLKGTDPADSDLEKNKNDTQKWC